MNKRTIKFRGYNLKNKKWLYGYYLVNRGKHFIAEEGLQPPGMTWEDFEVEPESVGQYVCSVHGIDIYEGDLIEAKFDSFFSERIEGVIGYYEHGFCICNELGNPTSYAIRENCALNYKVIGNKYEEKLKISNP